MFYSKMLENVLHRGISSIFGGSENGKDSLLPTSKN